MTGSIRDRVAYPTRADAKAAGKSRSALAQVWRRSALARALKRDGMSRREYQQATQQLAQARRAAR